MRQVLGAFALAVVFAVSSTVAAAADQSDDASLELEGAATLYCSATPPSSAPDDPDATRPQATTVTSGSIWHERMVQNGDTCSPRRS
jgi:hypothetical protein